MNVCSALHSWSASFLSSEATLDERKSLILTSVSGTSKKHYKCKSHVLNFSDQIPRARHENNEVLQQPIENIVEKA